MKSVRKQLRRLRVDHELTQRDLALKAKMPVLRYWEIENGYRIADERDQKRIAKALGADAASVFSEVA